MRMSTGNRLLCMAAVVLAVTIACGRSGRGNEGRQYEPRPSARRRGSSRH